MARDFVSCDRGQLLLMPPSLVEWLPEDHLVWTILGAVDQMDLGRFVESYRMGAAGRAPYDPRMMVALLLYAYARGNRSSRGIERSCWEDVAFKVITGMRTQDHSTIAEFRRRHEAEIAELFDDVLGLCRRPLERSSGSARRRRGADSSDRRRASSHAYRCSRVRGSHRSDRTAVSHPR